MAGNFVITGGRPLNGTVRIPAAKNSVLPLLAASILCREPVRLCGVPRLSDVEDCLALLQSAGCSAAWQGADVQISGGPCGCALAEAPAARMRASILFCAPLLARLGRAETVLPGGCRIGVRPIDLHLAGLAQMGVQEQAAGSGRLVLAAPSGLHGADITLGFPSVGTTETLLLAAVTAQGETVLRGAAREPEIVDLAQFLNQCGGCIQGAGSRTIRVQGRRGLHGGQFTPAADRIVASTLACAVAAAGGRAQLQGCAPQLYAPVLEILEQMGCIVNRAGDSVEIARFGRLDGVGRVFTGVYPALATDAAPLLAAAMLCARSASSIEDGIFERRFACAEGFAAFGAAVNVRGRILEIAPCGPLRGAQAAAPDLRGGAALVVAALAARGTSRITGTEYIDRGYADFAQMLKGLHVQIVREMPTPPPPQKKTVSKTQN